jgi:hypothetical protein
MAKDKNAVVDETAADDTVIEETTEETTEGSGFDDGANGDDADSGDDDSFNTFSDGDDGDSLMVDLAGVEAMSFEPIPNGKYPVVMEKCSYEISKSSGKPMWNTMWSVVEGQFEGRKLFMYISFSEKALPMTKTNISHFAPELLEGPFNPKTVADENVLIGKTCIARVKIEKDQSGEDRSVIKGLLAGASAGDDFLS